VLGALFITLIPTTIGGLLSAVGIAGMDRLLKVNVLATSGRAVEAAGDVDTLLLDKTGTITFGNRMATEVIPAPGVRPGGGAEAAVLASLADETPEGRSSPRRPATASGGRAMPAGATAIPFTARPGSVGHGPAGRSWRKGAVDASDRRAGRTPRASRPSSPPGRPHRPLGRHAAGRREDGVLVGVIHLKDVVKPGVRSASPTCAAWACAR
jgi:K+-transporting ATPase ATPase B chain